MALWAATAAGQHLFIAVQLGAAAPAAAACALRAALHRGSDGGARLQTACV